MAPDPSAASRAAHRALQGRTALARRPGRVSAAFGRQSSSRFGTAVPRTGIEIATPRGTPVRAAHNGRVAYADTFTGFGRLVIVDHGRKAFSFYGYLDEINVRKRRGPGPRPPCRFEWRVSPRANRPCYFELRIDARPVNPIEWLKR